jgi:hypothetical protein
VKENETIGIKRLNQIASGVSMYVCIYEQSIKTGKINLRKLVK